MALLLVLPASLPDCDRPQISGQRSTRRDRQGTHLRDLADIFCSVVHASHGLGEEGAPPVGLGDNCRDDEVLQIDAGLHQALRPDQHGPLLCPWGCGWFSLDIDSSFRLALTESSFVWHAPAAVLWLWRESERLGPAR